MIPRLHRIGAAAAITLGASMLATAAFAQTQTTPQQAPTQSTAPANQTDTGPTPTDAELKQFANAVVDVQKIRKAEQPKIAAAQSADTQTKLKQATEQKMEAAVRSNHLSIHRYEQIAQVVQTNNTIREKVIKLMSASTKS